MRTPPGQRSRSSPWGGVELLERAIGYTRVSITLVTPALMSAATPCAGWDLRQLLAHMADSLTSLHEAGSVREVALHAGAARPAHPVGRLRTSACALLADWSAAETDRDVTARKRADVLVGGRPITSPVLTSAGALEVAVHGWDVARACGADRPLPGALAEDLLRVAPLLVSDADRPHRFAEPLTPRPGASASERLLAFLGRPVH